MGYRITERCNGCGACKKLCPVDAISGEIRMLHTVDGSLCIDCGACGRICPVEAVKDSFGIPCVMVKKSDWDTPRINKGLCISCGMCIDACPSYCLALSDAEGSADPHGYPYLENEKACIGCGFCARECPVDAIIMSKRGKSSLLILV